MEGLDEDSKLDGLLHGLMLIGDAELCSALLQMVVDGVFRDAHEVGDLPSLITFARVLQDGQLRFRKQLG